MFSASLSSLLGRAPRTGKRRGAARRHPRAGFVPALEALETRCLPASLDGGLLGGIGGAGSNAAAGSASALTVQNLNDSGPGSLRQAILQSTGNETITFAPGVIGTIDLLSALPDLTGTLRLQGPGAGQLTVRRDTAPGAPEFDIFSVTSGATVTISGLTLSDGESAGAGAISNAGTLTVADAVLTGNIADGGAGGAILNGGALTVLRCTIRGNGGTAIASGGTAVIMSSTISGNSSGGFGGGVTNDGTMTLTDSTVSGNSAVFGGGLFSHGTMTLTDCTVSGNTATGTSVTPGDGNGGGIYDMSSILIVTNSVIAGNSDDVNVAVGGTVISHGHNVIGTGTGSSSFTAGGDQVGVDPRLGPLQDNGGPTETMALLPGSPALNAGDPSRLGVADQRGVVRAGGVNVGAFQASASALTVAVATPAVAGAPMSLAVTATDRFGQPAVGYGGGRVVVSVVAGPGGFATGSTTTAALAQGVAAFSNLALDAAGSYTLRAATLPASPALSVTTTVAVTPAAAARLVFTRGPSDGTAGQALAVVRVSLEDAFGNVETGDSSTPIALAVASGPGPFTAASTATAALVQGVAAFSNLVLDTAGGYTLQATAPNTSLPAAVSPAFVVRPAAVAALAFVAAPGGATAGQGLAAVKVAAEDAFGNVVSSFSGPVRLSVAGGPGTFTLGSTTLRTASHGVATFGNLVLTAAGRYTLQAKSSSASLPAATSSAVVVGPAAASKLAFTQLPGAGIAGRPLGTVQVSVEDWFGNVETADNAGAVSLSASGPGTFAPPSSLTAAVQNGTATFSTLTLTPLGTYRFKAVSGALPPAVSAALTLAADVSSSVAILGSVILPTGPNRYRQTLMITNTSGSPLSGRLALVVSSLVAGAAVAGASGSFLGNPYLTFLTRAKHLEPAETAIVTLTFLSPTAPSPAYAAQVLQGI